MDTAMPILILTCDMITIFVSFGWTPCLGWIHRIGIATRVKLIFVAEWKNTGWSRIGPTYCKTPLFVFNSSALTAQLKLKNPDLDLELSNLFVYVYKLKQRVLIPDRRAANKILSKISWLTLCFGRRSKGQFGPQWPHCRTFGTWTPFRSTRVEHQCLESSWGSTGQRVYVTPSCLNGKTHFWLGFGPVTVLQTNERKWSIWTKH